MNISLLTKSNANSTSEAVVAVKGTGLSVKSGVRAGVLYYPYRG
ncbi:MAG TPA: hypothetical protein PKY30_15135 [Myxococcota bacterium]|nr:hypothetical protein [Myxococcota bacterium]HNH48374.1 hypothetical protein [Myxococcota bacterium]